jgi:hypothetical protein
VGTLKLPFDSSNIRRNSTESSIPPCNNIPIGFGSGAEELGGYFYNIESDGNKKQYKDFHQNRVIGFGLRGRAWLGVTFQGCFKRDSVPSAVFGMAAGD